MAKRWCMNFDVDAVLQHGLAEAMWLMQYQYAHGAYDYQGHATQIRATSANLNILTGIQVGDWLVAYLPNSTFYAIGEVIEPRDRPQHSGAARHADTVARTVRDHCHLFLGGVVRYIDTPALYEDFTDPWRCPAGETTENQPAMWEYPQRIDVRQWECVVPSGVQVGGLAEVTQFPAFRRAAFEIPEPFFAAVADALRSAGGSGNG